MKIRFILLLILIISASLSGSGQLSFEFGSDNLEGSESRLSSYIYTVKGNWYFFDTTKIKYAEIQENVHDYYNENYINNNLQIAFLKENLSGAVNLGISIFPSDNHFLQPEGSELLQKRTNALDLGGNFAFDDKKYILSTSLNYTSAQYKTYLLDLTEDDSTSEYDLSADFKAGLWLNDDLSLSAAGEVFDDLNKSSLMNYNRFFLQLQQSKKISGINNIRHYLEIGNSDLVEDEAWFLSYKARLNTRLNINWTLLNIIDYNLWLNNEKELLLGNTWIKSILRRTFDVSEHNDVSFAQLMLKYDFYSEIISSQISCRYYFNSLFLSSLYEINLGDNLLTDSKAAAALGRDFRRINLTAAYKIIFVNNSNFENSLSHTLQLYYNF